MNEWVIVGGAVLGTVVLLGGGGWITAMIRGGKNRDN